MELKLGSVMLLLSCSLQQSLWGILASVPQTNANKCKQKISSESEPIKRVQMIRRIPARCSGWDEAWSWISTKDCRTKYILDYVELPSAVQKVDPVDCEEEVATPTGNRHFNLVDERYLAIAFGLATVGLLILIVIIVISVAIRGHNRCSMCSSGPSYSSANASAERDNANHTAGNEYVDDEFKLAEPMYEEILDHTTAMKKLECHDDLKLQRYQNVLEQPDGENNFDSIKKEPMNGVHRRPVTPSAPYAEELQQTDRKCVPNEYSVFREKLVQHSDIEGQSESIYRRSDIVENSTDLADNTGEEGINKFDDDLKPKPFIDEDIIPQLTKEIKTAKVSSVLPADTNEPSVDSKENADVEEDIFKVSSHSYENLHKNSADSSDYESLRKSLQNDEVCVNSPSLKEQTGGQCKLTSLVFDSGQNSGHIGSISTTVKLEPSASSGGNLMNTMCVHSADDDGNIDDGAKSGNEKHDKQTLDTYT